VLFDIEHMPVLPYEPTTPGRRSSGLRGLYRRPFQALHEWLSP
jgi:hypothetical protein